jgi:hypothetical protein
MARICGFSKYKPVRYHYVHCKLPYSLFLEENFMQKRLYQFMVLLAMLALIMAGTTTAFADDGTTEPADAEEQVAEEPTPTETVEEILNDVPEGTDVVVISEEGVEPLATEAAAETVLASDPVWCPNGQVPGDAGCTNQYATVTDLVNNLGSYSGSGTIYFTSSYTTDDATLDHNNTNLANLTDLTVQGGWNGLLNGSGYALSGSTTFSGVPLTILNWTGSVTLNDIIVDSTAIDTGLYVETQGDINLTNVDATNNGFDGADLVNYEGTGNVTVNGGDFSGNDEAGLYILSSGTVTINNVTSDGNRNGVIVDNTTGTGSATISGSTFNNNTWTGVQVESAGDITLDNVDASDNLIGAYLNALSGTGNIFVQNNSTFNSNTEWGLKAFASDGNITLSDVIVDGNDVTEYGTWLKSYNGDVSITNSVFSESLGRGLLVVAGGVVTLTNVTASDNDANGAEVYSIHNFACFGNDNITVNVNNGTYNNNGGYDLYIEAGETATVNVSGATFGTGGLFVEPASNPCPPHEDKDDEEPGEHKPSNVVQIPETDGDPVPQDCENFSSTTLVFPDGSSVLVDCPFEGDSQASQVPQEELPGPLPRSLTFVSAVSLGLEDEGEPVTSLDDGALLTISFTIPEDMLGKHLSIVYWDPTANGGLGDWVELPLDQFGGAAFPLNPDDPNDNRMICSGFEQSGNTVSVTLNFPGVFALVAR